MRLGRLSFPVRFLESDVQALLKEEIEGKEWDAYEIKKPELYFFPYWIFTYHAFSQTSDEGGTKTTTEGEKGLLALDAQRAALDESVAGLYDSFENELVVKPSVEHFKVLRFRIQKSEAEQLARLKIAAKLGIDAQLIVIAGLKPVYFPVWICEIVLEEETMDLRIDGIKGAILSEEEVPFRGKTATELASETVSDLTNPINWLRYLFDLLISILRFIWSNPLSNWIKTQLWTNNRFRIGLLILAVLLILLYELGYISLPIQEPVRP